MVSRRIVGALAVAAAAVLIAAVSLAAPRAGAAVDPANPTDIGNPADLGSSADVDNPTACSPDGVVHTPTKGSYDELFAISSLNNTDVWAVGRYINAASRDETLIEHWDGAAFKQVASPNPKANDLLYGVDALSPTNIWAVGTTFPAKVVVQSTLIEHWNGRSWSVVPSPVLSTGSGLLRSVVGASPNDLWAVGTLLSGVTDTNVDTLVEHWDGTAWRVISSPNPGRYGDAFSSAAVISPRNVWAVGSLYFTKFSTKNLAEHWDGTTWSAVSIPDVDIDDSLASVTAVNSSDLWAVGHYFNDTGGGSEVKTLAEQFDGTTWSVVPTPSPSFSSGLAAVQAVTSDDVWAVGSGGPSGALVLHWSGKRWTVASEPSRPHNVNYLFALSVSGAPGVWAAGSFGGSGSITLAEHFCRL